MPGFTIYARMERKTHKSQTPKAQNLQKIYKDSLVRFLVIFSFISQIFVIAVFPPTLSK